MTGSDDRTAAPRKRAGPRAALCGFSILLGSAAVAMLPLPAAQAQFFPFPWSYPYYDGYPPPVPPGTVFPSRRMTARESGPRAVGSDTSYGVVPLAEIRRRVALLGYHLVAIPRHNERIYLAEAEDAHGLPHRLVFDAYEGDIIENTKLAVIPKKPALKPTVVTTSIPPGAEKKPAAETQTKSAAVTAQSKPAQDTNKK